MSAMTFTHHPRFVDEGAEWEFDPARIYEQSERGDCKPKGFWLSVDDDWRRWCLGDEYGLEYLDPAFGFEVDLTRCLVLASVDDLDEFTREFVAADQRYSHRVSWDRVAARWSGIVIAPYQWGRRLDGLASDWYYTWDCASACIWNLGVVTPGSHVSPTLEVAR